MANKLDSTQIWKPLDWLSRPASQLLGYDVFVSYSRIDGISTAKAIHTELTKINYRVFLDEEELPAGERLHGRLTGALARSRGLIIVATRGALDDDQGYLRFEIKQFLQKRRGTVIPVEAGGELRQRVRSDWKELRDYVWIDPPAVAGDLVPNAVREIQRQLRFRKKNDLARDCTVIVSVAVAALCIAAVLLWTQVSAARLSLRNAETQRSAALSEKKKAEHDAKIAEGAKEEADRKAGYAKGRQLDAEGKEKLAKGAEHVAEDRTREARTALLDADLERRGIQAGETSLRPLSGRDGLSAAISTLALATKTGRPLPDSLVNAIEEGAFASSWAVSLDSQPCQVDATSVVISCSVDGSRAILSTNTYPNRTYIYSLPSGRLLNSWGLEGVVGAISPDGSLLLATAYANQGGKTTLRRALTGEVVKEYDSQSSPVWPTGAVGVRRAVFLSSGREIALLDAANTVRILSAATGKPICPSLDVFDHQIPNDAFDSGHASLSVAPGRLLVRSGTTAQIWNTANGRFLGRVQVPYVAFDPMFLYDGRRVLIPDASGRTALVWDYKAESIKRVGSKHDAYIWSACVSPVDDTVALSGEDMAEVCHADSSSPQEPPIRLGFGSFSVRVLAMSRRGALYATSGDSLLLFDTHVAYFTPLKALSLGGGFEPSLALSSDNVTAVVVSRGNLAFLWKPWTDLASIGIPAGRAGSGEAMSISVAFAPDEKALVSPATPVKEGPLHSGENSLHIWQVADQNETVDTTDLGSRPSVSLESGNVVLVNGRSVRVLSTSPRKELTRRQFEERIGSCAISAGGKFVAVGFDSGIRVYSLPRWRLVGTACPGCRYVGAVSSGGDAFLGSNGGDWAAWHLKGGTVWRQTCKFRLFGYRHGFTQNFRRVVGVSGLPKDGVEIYDTTTGRSTKCGISSLAIHDWDLSPDGTLLALGSGSVATVWDVHSGKLLHRLFGHEGEVNTVAFSPDGKQLLTSSKDQTARIWNVTTGENRLTLRGHFGAVVDAEYSPSGKLVVTASEDGRLRIFRIDNAGVITTALSTLQGTPNIGSPGPRPKFNVAESP